MILKKSVSFLITVTFVFGVLFTTNASALPVNKDIAGDSTKTLQTIEAMNLQNLPDADATQIRAGFLPIIYYYAVMYGVPASYLAAATISAAGVPSVRMLLDAVAIWRGK